jgi:hypothetical protein
MISVVFSVSIWYGRSMMPAASRDDQMLDGRRSEDVEEGDYHNHIELLRAVGRPQKKKKTVYQRYV